MRTVHCLAILLASDSPASAKLPTLERLFPPGARCGQSLTVTATGTFDRWPVRAWVDGPGIEVKAEAEKGKLAIAVASDATPGVHWLRLYDEEGASAPRPFVVGTLPEAIEAGTKDGPLTLDTSEVTING